MGGSVTWVADGQVSSDSFGILTLDFTFYSLFKFEDNAGQKDTLYVSFFANSLDVSLNEVTLPSY